MSKQFRGNGGGLKNKLTVLATTVALSGAAALVPFAAVADHNTTHTIEQLQAQIVALQAQLTALLGSDSGSGSSGSGSTATNCGFTRDLFVGVQGDDVKCLQQYLNSAGFTLASSGAGSPGSETTYFGSITRAGVIKWQNQYSAQVLVPVGLSAGTGYWGSSSRGHYNTLIASAPPPTTTPPPVADGGDDDDAPVVVTPVGSGLTVTPVASQPAARLAPQSAARLPFVEMIFTASSDGDVAVDSVTVERKGLAEDAAFDGILLLDEDGTQIGNTKTLTSDHQVVLNDSLVIEAGTSQKIIVAANMSSDLSSQTGQLARLEVIAVDAGDTTVNGTFPIASNSMTVNSTLSIGSVTMSIGSLDPGAANTKEVGTEGYYFAAIRAAVGSGEDVTFESIRFNQAGSAAGADIENVIVQADQTDYEAVLSSDGKYYTAMFGDDGIAIKKGGNLEFSIKADIEDGSDRTIDMNILRKSDVVVKGDTFDYYILPGGGSSGSASAGAFSTNQEPYFNAYAATISKGSLLVSSSNQVPSGNIPVDVADTTLGGFMIEARGEPIQISSFKLNFKFTGTGTSTDVTNVKIVDANGDIQAGPKDPSSGVITYTDTWTVPVGENHYFIKGKPDTSFVSDDTIQVLVDPDDNLTVKGQVTGLSVTPSPTSAVDAKTQTVKAASVEISVSETPFGQNVVRGVNKYHFATYLFDAGKSGEDVRVTSIQLRDTISASGVGDEVNSCVLYDGATQLNTGSDVQNPSDPSGTTNDVTFTLSNNLIVPKGTVKKIDLKCNISSAATADSTHSWGTNAAAGNIGSVGADTGSSITETITTSTGSIMSVKTAGSFTVVKDAAAPSAAIVLAGKTDVPMNVLKYHATDEDIDINDITLTYSTSTASTSDFVRATVWDGATRIGEAVWVGSAQNATSTFTSDFIVPKDGDKLMTIKADMGSISVTASTTAGQLLAITYNGVSSSTGTGQASGQKLGSSSGTNAAGSDMQIMKTVPTLTKIAVPSTTLPGTDLIMYRFSVKADAAGPVALYKFTFSVSSSSVSATSSNFRLFGYSDSSFSVKAYDNNPVHASNVDCAGQSNMETDTTCGADTTGSGTASSTVTGSGPSEVVFFFGPSKNTASTTEAITVPAGGTRYFEVRGDITNPGTGTGNSMTVKLSGDAARPVRESGSTTVGAGALGFIGFNDAARGYLGTAAAIASQSANNDFVWSPMSTTTSLTGATSTTDWTNGFLVPGLPSTSMSANTFSN